MPSNYLTYIRLGTFVTTLLFSLIVLCVSADLVSLTNAQSDFGFSALSLTTGLLTLITLGPMLLIDMNRQGSIFSYIVVEISCIAVLWVLWLSTGSYAASTDNTVFGQDTSCNFGDFFIGNLGRLDRACHETQAVVAFSFLTWIILMGYTVMLLVLGLRAQERGRPAWKTGVRDGALLFADEKAVGSVGMTPPTLHPTYPPPTQQTLPSSVSQSYTAQV